MGILIAIGIAVVAGAVGYVSYYWLGADNVVEEKCEKVIEDETGAKIDLTPGTLDKEALQEAEKIAAPTAPTSEKLTAI